MASMALLVLHVAVGCVCAAGRAWPASATSGDSLPNVEISLEAPANPHPDVSAEIGSLDDTRATAEAAGMLGVQRAYVAAVEREKESIGNIVGQAMRAFSNPPALYSGPAFVAVRNSGAADESTATSSFKVNVIGSAGPGIDVRGPIGKIESARSDMERASFEQAKRDFDAAVDFFLRELESQIQTEVNKCVGSTPTGLRGFARSPQQANVRVVASESAYPTIESLVQAMEDRRDASEKRDALQILNMQLQLFELGNAMAKEALSHAIERISA